MDLISRITTNSDHCGGRPCIRNMRIRVVDVLQLLAAGLSADHVLRAFPTLTIDDLRACLLYAAKSLEQVAAAAPAAAASKLPASAPVRH
jgi:uncharacterized protein (DUF433 family)